MLEVYQEPSDFSDTMPRQGKVHPVQVDHPDQGGGQRVRAARISALIWWKGLPAGGWATLTGLTTMTIAVVMVVMVDHGYGEHWRERHADR
jgi:hypothetical protein